ncbi:MAG: apolipoprotein N-acyltransferase [Elusimicrobiota bacterium]
MISFISGILYSLLFPKFNLYFLFPVALAPLIYYGIKYTRTNRHPKILFLYFLGSGTVANLILLYWIYPTLYRNGAGPVISVLGLILLSAYIGLYWGMFSFSIYYTKCFKPLYRIIFIAISWVLLEYIRAHLFTGFPWLLLGYSLWKIKPMIQIADITGIYGISFIIVLINVSISFYALKRNLKLFILPFALIFLFLSYGILKTNSAHSRPDLKVCMLQGNISQYKKWNSAFKHEILNTYGNLHKKAQQHRPDLIIWPETAIPGVMTREPELMNYIKELTADSDAYELIGSVEKANGKYYNSVYLISPKGEIVDSYRKVHLTPFGEYIPFRIFLSPFAGVVNEVGDFEPGDNIRLLKFNDYKISTGICFEGIFPSLVRRFFKQGSNIFVNVTNDGWFLNTAGPYQHFVHSVLRAVENRTYVLRTGNTGISAIVSPKGKILKKTGLLKETILCGKAGISENLTFYQKFGNLFVVILFFSGIFIILLSNWKEIKCLKNIKNK